MNDAGFYKCPKCESMESERRLRCPCGYSRATAEPPRRNVLRAWAKSAWRDLGPILILVGAFLLWQGWQERTLRANSTDSPVGVRVEDLEAGVPPPQTHLYLQRHVRRYDLSMYTVNLKEEHSPEATTVDFLYPVVSAQAARGDQFVVLVVSKDHHRLKYLPTQPQTSNGMQGMILNSVQDLDPNVRDLLKRHHPELDLSRILIFQEGRSPISAELIPFYFYIGGSMCAVGVLGLIWLWTRPRRAAPSP